MRLVVDFDDVSMREHDDRNPQDLTLTAGRHNKDDSPALYLHTGDPDQAFVIAHADPDSDPEGAAIHAWAHAALTRQDTWSAEQHATFFARLTQLISNHALPDLLAGRRPSARHRRRGSTSHRNSIRLQARLMSEKYNYSEAETVQALAAERGIREDTIRYRYQATRPPGEPMRFPRIDESSQLLDGADLVDKLHTAGEAAADALRNGRAPGGTAGSLEQIRRVMLATELALNRCEPPE